VPPGSPFQKVADVDRPGTRIAVYKGSAYDLWLTRNIKHATLVRSEKADDVFKQFVGEGLEAFAGLRTALLKDAGKLEGARILPGHFTTVQQAIGTLKTNTAAAAFLRDFVEEAKRSGLVASLIEKHKVVGLTVAPPA
jgi:polar amino acid transport system substrate-binding protein